MQRLFRQGNKELSREEGRRGALEKTKQFDFPKRREDMSIRYEKRTILNRKQYKDVKRLDREQMESYLINLYMEGYEDGRKSVPGVDVTAIRGIISSIKGIGEKRTDEIIKRIEEAFKEDSNGRKTDVHDEDCGQ